MLTFGSVLLVAAVTFVGWILYDWLLKPRRAPAGLRPLPGPLGLPLVGCLPFLGAQPHYPLTKYADLYGPIYQLRIGFRTVIVLCTAEVMKETSGKDPAFAGRPDLLTLQVFAQSGGKSRFSFRTGNPTWRFLRKLATRSLALFANSRNSRLQYIVSEAFDKMEKKLQEQSATESSFNPSLTIGNAVGTSVGTILFGEGVDATGIVRENMQAAPIFQKMLSVGIMDYFPGIGMEYFLKDRLDAFKKAIVPINKYVEAEIIKHDAQLNRNGVVEDVADALAEAADETDLKLMADLGIDKDDIKLITQDLFGAGLTTTIEMMKWSITMLAAHPDIQKKAHEELDSQMHGEAVTFEHLNQLPYNHAIQLETLRLVTLTPLGLPQSIMHDTSYEGYYIPANAVVFQNIFAQNHHPNVFFRPYEFFPERFLTNNEKIDTKEAEKVCAFGVGKRRCVGENLAKQELFMFLSRTLQNFDIEPAPGVKIDIMKSTDGFFRSPLDYKFVFKKRSVEGKMKN